MSNTPVKPVATVSHQGVVFAFAGSEDPAKTEITYNVLELDVESRNDELDWSGFQPLEFPSELRPAGMQLVGVPAGRTTTGGFVNAPFQVLSDGQHVVVFRQTLVGTLTATRFAMVADPGDRETERTVRTLKPAWEVRFQRSGKKDVPAGDRDIQSFQSLDKEKFIEPVVELSMVRGLTGGRFCVVLLPSQSGEGARWQIFVYNTDTSRIESFSLSRADTGLFDLSDKTVDPQAGVIPPDAAFTIALKDGKIPLSVVSGLAATFYSKQERAATQAGEALQLKRNGRVMLSFAAEHQGAGGPVRQAAAIDFAVASDGTLAGIEPETLVSPIDPADHTLSFDGVSVAQLENASGSLNLAGSFTLEAWIFSRCGDTGRRLAIGGPAGEQSNRRAPYLELLEGTKVVAGFGDGTSLCEVVTTNRVVSPSVWKHVAVTFDEPTNSMAVYLNGLPVATSTDTFPGSKPSGTPLTRLGSEFDGFEGNLEEVRVWSHALPQADIRSRLYRALTAKECADPALAAYWKCDVTEGTSGSRIATPDSSSYHNPALLGGPKLVATTSPVAPASQAEMQIDDRGLTVLAGVLDFARPKSTPSLLEGADGLVHLYYQGPDEEFLVAQFDAIIARAIYYGGWETPEPGGGESTRGLVAFVAHRSGELMNHASVNVADGPQEDLATVEFRTSFGATEIWHGVPRDLFAFSSVFQGEAVGDPADLGVHAGAKVYYDYAGKYPECRLEVTSPDGPAHVRVISARPDTGAQTPGAVPLWKISVDTAGNEPGFCTVRTSFLPKGAAEPAYQTWAGVPIESGAFERTLSGLEQGYPYDRERPNDAKIFSLAAGKASRVLFIATTVAVTEAALRVTAAASGDAALCDVAVTVTTDAPLKFSWSDVPRQQTNFAARLRAPNGGGASLRDYLFVTTDSLFARVTDQESSKADGLRAAASLVHVISEGGAGVVEPKTVAADKLQHTVRTNENSDLTKGSELFAVAPASFPETGAVANVQNVAAAALGQSGVSGGWVAETPRYAVAFQRSDATVEVLTDRVAPLELRGDRSFEAWVRPAGVASAAFPRVLHFFKQGDPDLPNDVSQYLLALGVSGRLEFVGLNQAGTKIELGSVGALVTPNSYTVQAWLRPNLQTIAAGQPQSLWDFSNPAGTGGPGGAASERLTLDSQGVFEFRLEDGSSSTSVKTLAGAVKTDQWCHVGLIRDGATTRLLVDGVVVAAVVDSITMPLPSLLTVGGNSGSYILETQMNDFRVWNRPLGEAEAAENYFQNVANDTPGLTLRWPLSEGKGTTVVNVANSGSDYDAAIHNGYHWGTPGVFSRVVAGANRTVVATEAVVAQGRWAHLAAVYATGTALEFSGREFADAGNDPGLDFDDTLTVECWVQLTRAASAGLGQVVVSKWGMLEDEQSFQLGVTAENRPFFSAAVEDDKSQSTYTVAGAAALVVNTPYHLAAVYTAETTDISESTEKTKQKVTIRLYVNGTEAGKLEQPIESGAVSINRSSTPLNFGRTRPDATGADTHASQQNLRGYLSDVRLWNRALTASEVSSIYRTHRVSASDGAAAWWRFDEMQGKVALDSEGTNNAILSSNRMWRYFDANATLDVYVDGARQAALKPTTAGEVGGFGQQQLRMGGMRTSSGAFDNGLSGEIDEVRVWATDLTAEQITDNMYRVLAGNEEDLKGYWRFDAGSGVVVQDYTGLGNDARLEAGAAGSDPEWVTSTAPLSNEAPEVRNVLGGLETDLVARIGTTPGVTEYGDTQRDGDGALFAVRKRFYVAATESRVELITGFKVGDLTLKHVGQVQTKPTLIGFIEGAPPLPSENLSQPYYQNAAWSDYLFYVDASSVTLRESNESVRSFASTKESGFDLSVDAKAGLFFVNEVSGGSPFLHKDLVDLDGKVVLHTTFDFSQSSEAEQGAKASIARTITSTLASEGDWEEPDGDGRYLNSEVGRRFLPGNRGYALVKSLTADMYATTLKSTGALVSVTLVPNQDIPEDMNILSFPIDPAYTHNGTLDGQVGLEPDPATSVSYFRPLEAYSLKRRIERQTKELESYWTQFDAEGAGMRGSAGLGELEDEDPYHNWKKGLAKKGIANTYVWSTYSGLYKEEEEYSSSRSESYGGSYHFKGMGGLEGEGQGAFFGLGWYADVDFLLGSQIDVKVMKTKETSTSFGLDLELKCEAFLKKFLDDTQTYSAGSTPGKVEAYRFTTFYLPPEERNYSEFFGKVIDQNWLARSNDPQAAALREATTTANGVWRVLHRVTYVSRVPPTFQTAPAETVAPEDRPPANIEANAELIQLVADKLGERPTPLEIGHGVNSLLDDTLSKTLPWWPLFLTAAGQYNSDAQRVLRDLRRDLLAYMIDAYATGSVGSEVPADLRAGGRPSGRPSAPVAGA